MHYPDLEATIVAQASPPGVGAVSMIRVSGAQSFAIVQSVFKGADIRKADSHTLHYGFIVEKEEVIDEVMLAIFRAPKSYTTEDSVEISTHGSPFIVSRVLQVLIDNGARMAQAGEFTMRAFINGRLDLSQAEAVADLIESNSKASQQMALNQMRGGFSGKIQNLREQLIHFASMIELELDFSEEDVEFANRADLINLVTEIQTLTDKLIRSFQLGNVLKNGVNTVIAGRPNAGKSTLMNNLLNEERAIVSDIAGTTRDSIEEVLNIEGMLFRLIDTAGIREATDTIEKIGVERTLQKIKTSAVLLYLFDAVEMDEETVLEDLQKLDLGELPHLLIGTKSDLANKESLEAKFPSLKEVTFVNNKSEKDAELLKEKLYALFASKGEEHDVLVNNARHYEALKKSEKALDEVLSAIEMDISGELLALDIRTALNALGQITGAIDVDEDILGTIFGKFCIGK